MRSACCWASNRWRSRSLRRSLTSLIVGSLGGEIFGGEIFGCQSPLAAAGYSVSATLEAARARTTVDVFRN